VRVNAVLPAECDTDQHQRCFASQPDPAATGWAIENLVPLGRWLTTLEAVAARVVFRASPVSAHTTGQIIFVGGGYAHPGRALTSAHRPRC
jgi:L-fucose dehydrogenase